MTKEMAEQMKGPAGEIARELARDALDEFDRWAPHAGLGGRPCHRPTVPGPVLPPGSCWHGGVEFTVCNCERGLTETASDINVQYDLGMTDAPRVHLRSRNLELRGHVEFAPADRVLVYMPRSLILDASRALDQNLMAPDLAKHERFTTAAITAARHHRDGTAAREIVHIPDSFSGEPIAHVVPHWDDFPDPPIV